MIPQWFDRCLLLRVSAFGRSIRGTSEIFLGTWELLTSSHTFPCNAWCASIRYPWLLDNALFFLRGESLGALAAVLFSWILSSISHCMDVCHSNLYLLFVSADLRDSLDRFVFSHMIGKYNAGFCVLRGQLKVWTQHHRTEASVTWRCWKWAMVGAIIPDICRLLPDLIICLKVISCGWCQLGINSLLDSLDTTTLWGRINAIVAFLLSHCPPHVHMIWEFSIGTDIVKRSCQSNPPFIVFKLIPFEMLVLPYYPIYPTLSQCTHSELGNWIRQQTGPLSTEPQVQHRRDTSLQSIGSKH
jgi:hypothetical protein